MADASPTQVIVEPHQINGLIVARTLLDRADSARDGSAPGEIIAVVLLDLAIESGAKVLLGDQLKKGANFRETIQLLNDTRVALGSDGLFEGTKRVLDLRELRNLVQHSGSVPSSEDVDRYRIHARDFLETVTRFFVGCSLRDVSLASLIVDDDLRQAVLNAEAAVESGDAKAGAQELAQAYEVVLDLFRSRQPWRRRGNTDQYRLRRAVDALKSDRPSPTLSRKLKDLLSAIPTRKPTSSFDIDKIVAALLQSSAPRTDPLLHALQGFATELQYLNERAEVEALVRDVGDHSWFRARVGRARPAGSTTWVLIPADPPLEVREMPRALAFVMDTAMRNQRLAQSPAPAWSPAGLHERRQWEALKERIVQAAAETGEVTIDDLVRVLDDPNPDDVEPALGELVEEGRLQRAAAELYVLPRGEAID